MTLTTLTRYISAMRHARSIMREQQELIRRQAAFIQAQADELVEIRLDHLREIEGLISGWLIHIEQPEVDLRDDLIQLADQCRNSVARLEEHVL